MTPSPAPPEADPARRRRRQAWGLQGAGMLIALAGLLGFWLTRDVARSELTTVQRELLGVVEGDFTASFLVAGRDQFYAEGPVEPVYGRGGAIVGWNYRGPRHADGANTDTILYVQIVNDDVTIVAIPRDLFVEQWGKVNSVYQVHGADGLRRTVEDVLGLPVDYFVIINLEIFRDLVDALGGVEVNVPYRMEYRDIAGGLYIDLQPGPQVLDGKRASDFVRYRNTTRGDFDRLDRLMTLAYATLQRVRELNIRAVTKLPELIDTFFDDVETNASAALIGSLLPRLSRLRIEGATLPVIEVDTTNRLFVDRAAVEGFLAATFGGSVQARTEAPDAPLHIVNRSGVDGLEERYRDRLSAMGVPDDRMVLSSASLDPAPTRVVATLAHWEDADFYSALLGLGKHSIDRLQNVQGRSIGMQLILGEDAPMPGPDFARLAATVAAGTAAP